jgi:hypothetical protein
LLLKKELIVPTIVTPKHLTVGVCKAAVKIALCAVMEEGSILHTVVKRPCCHIVVLVPGMEIEGHSYPNYPIHPVAIYDHSFGDREGWAAKYDEIAQCKALQLWHDRNDEKPGVECHLLFPGDTVYWGGVKRHGIVVTCSGIQPFYDQLISGITADSIKALSYSAFEGSGDANKDFV